LTRAPDEAIVFRADDWACEVAPGFETPGWYFLRLRRPARLVGLGQPELTAFAPVVRDLMDDLLARRLNRRDRSSRVAPYERYRRYRPGAVLADRWSQAWLTNFLRVLPYRLPPVAASRLIVGTGAAPPGLRPVRSSTPRIAV
jgi:hypothetical protein